LNPIRVEVFAASEDTRARVDQHLAKWGGLRNQRSLDQYRIKTIRTERELAPDPSYEPEYPSFPLGTQDLDIELTAEESGWLREMVERGLARDEPQALRAAIFEWYGA